MFSVFLYLINYDSHFQLFNESSCCHDVKPFFKVILQPLHFDNHGNLPWTLAHVESSHGNIAFRLWLLEPTIHYQYVPCVFFPHWFFKNVSIVLNMSLVWCLLEIFNAQFYFVKLLASILHGARTPSSANVLQN
jgi:hypothetical protein